MMYKDYKRPAYEWLPDIPHHWQELFIQQVSHEQKNRNTGNIERLVLSLSYGNIIRKKNVDAGLVAKDLSTYQIVDKNNIILRFTDLQNDHKSLRTGLVKERGIITSAYTCIVPTINAAYLHYVLHSYDTQKVFYGMGGGVRQSIGYDDIRHMFVPVPPNDEQDQIVRYLDWQISRINKLIHGYQRQIRLLQEKTQKLTCDAVLHGLNEKAAMKPSGIQNIDLIPEHWRVLQNKRIFAERTEFSETGQETLLSVSKHYGVKPYYSLEEGEQYATIKPAESLVGYKIVLKNDIAMNIMRARNGSFGVSEYDGIVSPAYAVFRPIIDCNPQYMHYLLRTPHVIGIFESYSYGIAEHRRRLYAVDFLRLYLPVPPVNEQDTIVQYIESIQERTKEVTDRIQKEIDLLREYRTRLISDVVTGQMDVRGIEIPDYSPEEDTEETDEDNEETEVEPNAESDE